MTYSDTQPRGTLRYRLLAAAHRPASSQPLSEPGSWGHEYVRHLAAELGEEYNARELGEELEKPAEPETTKVDGDVIGTVDDLRALAMECASFLLRHNAEPDAVDLMQELEIVTRLPDLVDKDTFERVCQYMERCVNLLPQPDDITFLRTAHRIYKKHTRFPQALSLSIKLGDPELIREDFEAPANDVMNRQLAFILARAQVPKEWLDPPVEDEEAEGSEVELPEDLLDCLNNTYLSIRFREFGKELGVLEPKSLEDIYKSHLENTSGYIRVLGRRLMLTCLSLIGATAAANVDSARANLAGTFVNAFVNAGFGNDKLMVEAEDGQSWIYKNKDHGTLSW